MKTVFSYRGYRVLAEKNDGETRELIDEILSGIIETVELYKENLNSYTARINFRAKQFILKIPQGRNRKYYMRFFSLFRDSEPFRRYNDMYKLKDLGLKGPSAVLAAEKRSFGMVQESFLIYTFIDGREAVSGDEDKVMQELYKLHRLGYMRKDSKLENFLISGDHVYFIDFKLSKPIIFKDLRIDLELASFVRTMPNIINYIDKEKRMGLIFKFAVSCDKIMLKFKRWRRKLRSQLLSPFEK